MPCDLLISARAKLARAKHHVEQLKLEIDIGENDQLYGFTDRTDPKTGEYVLLLKRPPDLFRRYSIIAGEAIHQMRSALEHAVWNMVPNPIQGFTGFPVVWEASKYDAKAEKLIKDINPAAAAYIKRLQPFDNGGDESRLYNLNEMWNADKHRLLNLTGFIPMGYMRFYRDRATGKMLGNFGHEIIAEGAENGAEILRFQHPSFYEPSKVEMIENYAYTLGFKNPVCAMGQPPVGLLLNLLGFSEKVVDDLETTLS